MSKTFTALFICSLLSLTFAMHATVSSAVKAVETLDLEDNTNIKITEVNLVQNKMSKNKVKSLSYARKNSNTQSDANVQTIATPATISTPLVTPAPTVTVTATNNGIYVRFSLVLIAISFFLF